MANTTEEKNTDPFPSPVGRVCLWYYHGTMGVEPRLALVTRPVKGGGIELTVFPCGTTQLTTVSGVRHKDDPWLIQHPTHAYECGCWDYLPGTDPRPAKLEVLEMEKVSSNQSLPNAIATGPGSRAFQKK